MAIEFNCRNGFCHKLCINSANIFSKYQLKDEYFLGHQDRSLLLVSKNVLIRWDSRRLSSTTLYH